MNGTILRTFGAGEKLCNIHYMHTHTRMTTRSLNVPIELKSTLIIQYCRKLNGIGFFITGFFIQWVSSHIEIEEHRSFRNWLTAPEWCNLKWPDAKMHKKECICSILDQYRISWNIGSIVFQTNDCVNTFRLYEPTAKIRHAMWSTVALTLLETEPLLAHKNCKCNST